MSAQIFSSDGLASSTTGKIRFGEQDGSDSLLHVLALIES